MGLKDLKLPTESVQVPGGDSFTVRGLSLVDITTIIRGRQAEVSALFDRYRGQVQGAPDIESLNTSALGGDLLQIAPEIAAVVIAAASGEPDSVDVALTLPFTVQLDAIEKIGKLTFDAEGGPKKVVETVIRVLKGSTSLMTDLRASKAGSLGFAAK